MGAPVFLATSLGAGIAFLITRNRSRTLVTWAILILMACSFLGIGAARGRRADRERVAAELSPPSMESLCAGRPHNPPPYDADSNDSYEALIVQTCGERIPQKVSTAAVLDEFYRNELNATRKYRWKFVQTSGRIESIRGTVSDENVATITMSAESRLQPAPGTVTARFVGERKLPLQAVRRGEIINVACWVGEIAWDHLTLRNCELIRDVGSPVSKN
jgi:hypothetical protein